MKASRRTTVREAVYGQQGLRLRPLTRFQRVSDPDFSSVSLLLHMDGTNGSTTFTDSSSNALTVTANGNAQISTAQSKWGGASGSFDGSGDYLDLTDAGSVLTLSADFTLELWAYFNSLSGIQVIAQSVWGHGSGALALWHHVDYSNKLSLWVESYNTSAPLIAGTTTLSVNTWYHIAVTRSGNNWALFLNGSSEGTATSSAAVTRPIKRVGAYVDPSNTTLYFLNAYTDDLRITKGVSRAIVLPTGPFPNF